jgi:protein-disulfide isomerase
MLQLHPDTVSLIFRHFPLEEIHPNALLAAEATEAAGAQARFWEMHDLLLSHRSHLDRSHLRTFAEQLELDIPAFVGALVDETYRQRVREDIEHGRQSGVRATPTFFVNDELVDISYGVERLYELVDVLAKRR